MLDHKSSVLTCHLCWTTSVGPQVISVDLSSVRFTDDHSVGPQVMWGPTCEVHTCEVHMCGHLWGSQMTTVLDHKSSVLTCHLWGSSVITCGKLHKIYFIHKSLKVGWKSLLKNVNQISEGLIYIALYYHFPGIPLFHFSKNELTVPKVNYYKQNAHNSLVFNFALVLYCLAWPTFFKFCRENYTTVPAFVQLFWWTQCVS